MLGTDRINVPRSVPYVERSLNWVTVAQRFPVRVRLEDPPPESDEAGRHSRHRGESWRRLQVAKRPRASARLLTSWPRFPGRLEFAARLALICALTTLVAEIYQTPEPALTAYVAFFVIKPDRMASIVVSVIMLALVSLIIGAVFLISIQVIDQPFWRVTSMALISFGLLFAASASKLKPIAAIVALITAYALDLLGEAQIGELATRGAALRLAVRRHSRRGLRRGQSPPRSVAATARPARDGPSSGSRRPDAARVRRQSAAGVRGRPARGGRRNPRLAETGRRREDIARTGHRRAAAGLPVHRGDHGVGRTRRAATRSRCCRRPFASASRETLDEMAAILGEGGYPVDIAPAPRRDPPLASPLAAAALEELHAALTGFAKPAAAGSRRRPPGQARREVSFCPTPSPTRPMFTTPSRPRGRRCSAIWSIRCSTGRASTPA